MGDLPVELILLVALLADPYTAYNIYKSLGYDDVWIEEEMSKRKDIYFWNGENEVPENVTFVIIKEGVTTISDGAFQWCDSLENVVIPNSVTSIGSYAFSYCDSLENVVIPNSVTTIGQGAFFCCINLDNVVIPDSVTTIDQTAFGRCINLDYVVLLNKLTSFTECAFPSHTKIIRQ
jgi:hypothetical protein